MFNKLNNKNKNLKRSKYVFKASDYEITTLVNTLESAVSDLKAKIESCEDTPKLSKLIYQKYALLEIIERLGFSCFTEELQNKKSIDKEIKIVLDNKKKNISSTIESKVVPEIINKEPVFDKVL